MPIKPPPFNFRTLNTDCPLDESLQIIQQIADAYDGRFVIEYVKNDDHGDYAAAHNDNYEVRLCAGRYSAEEHGNLLSAVIMDCCIAFLQDVEARPAKYNEALTALRQIDDATLRGLVEEYIHQELSPDAISGMRYNLVEAVRRPKRR